jgi:prevent-host-death family protein
MRLDNMLYNCAVKVVTAAYAKANLGQLLEQVIQGERILISRYNKPVAELSPPNQEKRPKPKLGTGRGKVKILDPNWAKPMTDKEIEDMFG